MQELQSSHAAEMVHLKETFTSKCELRFQNGFQLFAQILSLITEKLTL